MSEERFGTFGPMTADQIETARIMASSVHHAGKIHQQLEKAKRDLVKNNSIIADCERQLPRLRNNSAAIEQNIRTLESIIAEAD